MHRGITSASAGDTVRFPANGTDSHITNNVAIIPLAEPKSDGTPLKYSSIEQHNGYVVITLAEGFTSLTGIGILVYDRTQRS